MAEYLLNNQNALMLISRAIVLLICFPVHECAHAWTADLLGDSTGRTRGRISLNPLRHLDYMGTIMILLVGVGYAKPVPVNINRFQNRKRDFALTALAGPVSNLLMAILFLAVLRISFFFSLSPETRQLLGILLVQAAFINVSLAVFNLIPIPPLDGSRVVTALLPDRAYNRVLQKERHLMVILLIAMVMLGRMGVSPIGYLSNRVFDFLYIAVVGR